MAASAFTVPFAVPAVTFLAVLGATIGRTRGLEVKPGWVAHPNLYWALVARSGMGKSPCSSAILKPVHEREHKAFQEHQRALGEHDIAMREWQSAFVQAQRRKQTLPEKPDPPHWEQVYIEDSTTQAVGAILADNPRGVFWYRDELSGLLADLGRYDSKGGEAGDKARLLSAYDCGPWKVSRSTKDGLHIPHACVSIFGTVQPGLLPSLFKQRDAISGFLPRFLFIRCEQEAPPLWTPESFCGEPEEYLHDFIKKALQLTFRHKASPHIIPFSHEAMQQAISWHDRQVLTHWYQPHLEQFEALAPKLRGAFFKLCLTMHILNCWSEETTELIPVQVKSVEQTSILMEWIQEQQRQVWTLIATGTTYQEASSLERRVARTILKLVSEGAKPFLPTSDIVASLNQHLDQPYHVTAESVGKTYRKLGLETGRSNKERGVKLTSENIVSLSQVFSLEKSVTTVTKEKNIKQYQADKGVTLPVTLDLEPSPSVTPQKPLHFSTLHG